MKIKIKREGGFIGITSKANLEYDDLTKAEQSALDALAEQSIQSDGTSQNEKDDSAQTKDASKSSETSNPQLNNKDIAQSQTQARALESDKPRSNGKANIEMPHNVQGNMMRDAFSYSISMKKNGKTVSMTFDDMNAPPEIVEIFHKYVQY